MKVKLLNVRIAFTQNLWTAGAFAEGQEKKFDSTFLLPKGGSEETKVKKTITAVSKEQWKNKAESVYKTLAAQDKVCIKDGDMKEGYDGFAEHSYIKGSNKVRPKILGRDKSQLTEEDGVIYAGCRVNALLAIWAQDNKWGKRVNAKLLGLQFVADDDAFGSIPVASDDDFDVLSDTGENDDDLLG